MILKGFLLDRFGRFVPLCLQATVCMEQSYSDIDGDSASLAEVCAMISSLAKAPIRQDVAMTGSIDQLGNAQAVGGVNEKIEGFFRVCRERAPDRVHEVIIPASNARDLMLDEEILDACAKGLFKVTTVETIEDALFVLTGERWNPPLSSSSSQPGLYARSLAALDELAAVQSLVNLQPRGRHPKRTERARKAAAVKPVAAPRTSWKAPVSKSQAAKAVAKTAAPASSKTVKGATKSAATSKRRNRSP